MEGEGDAAFWVVSPVQFTSLVFVFWAYVFGWQGLGYDAYGQQATTSDAASLSNCQAWRSLKSGLDTYQVV